MLMGESQGCLDSNGACDTPSFACFKDGEGATEDATCYSEPAQCCWNDAEVGQESEDDSEDNRYNACVESCESPFLVDVALHESFLERWIFEGVFAMERIF